MIKRKHFLHIKIQIKPQKVTIAQYLLIGDENF